MPNMKPLCLTVQKLLPSLKFLMKDRLTDKPKMDNTLIPFKGHDTICTKVNTQQTNSNYTLKMFSININILTLTETLLKNSKPTQLTIKLLQKHCILQLKVACTSGPFFEKIMKRYPIFSLQNNYHQIDQRHK